MSKIKKYKNFDSFQTLNPRTEFSKAGWSVGGEINLSVDDKNRICAKGSSSPHKSLNWIKTNRLVDKKLPWTFGVLENVGFEVSSIIDSWINFPEIIKGSVDSSLIEDPRDNKVLSSKSALKISNETPELIGCPTRGYQSLILDNNCKLSSLKGVPDTLRYLVMKNSSIALDSPIRIKDFEGINTRIASIVCENVPVESFKGLNRDSELLRLEMYGCPIRELKHCPRVVHSTSLMRCGSLISLKGLSIYGNLTGYPEYLKEQAKRFDLMRNFITPFINKKYIAYEECVRMILEKDIHNLEFFYDEDVPDMYKKDLESYRGAVEWM